MISPGDAEDLRLEFKAADVLENPVNVAREAAAMLNASGGEIWIGVDERDGKAVNIAPIPDAERARVALLDALVARLEPSPTSDEIAVKTDNGLLLVTVSRGKRGPYAFLERGMRGYVLRVDARIRPLSREEIQKRFEKSTAPGDEADGALKGLRGPDRTPSDGAHPGLFVFLVPSEKLDLNLREPRIEEFLRDPELSGNRRLGWNFAGQFHSYRAQRGEGVWSATHPSHALVLNRRGDLFFSVPIKRLQWKGGPTEIYPWALVEFVVSVCRLYPKLVKLNSALEPGEMLLAASIRGIAGWTLRPYSPMSVGYEIERPGATDADIEPPPIRVQYPELRDAPDRCGWRLLEQLYDAFGFGEKEMPPEYNRKTERLVIPR